MDFESGKHLVSSPRGDCVSRGLGIEIGGEALIFCRVNSLHHLMSETNFVLSQFVGRFHPLLVHLPIGFLLLLAVLELLAVRPRFKHLATASRVILIVSVPVTLGAALTGWLLASGGDYSSDLLFQHRWAGVAVAVCSVVLLVVHQRHQVRLYRWLLLALVGLLGFAGHQGGSLTHGSDYLAKFAPGPLRSLLGGGKSAGTPQGNGAFATTVFPILKRSCLSCHSAEKSKAGLRMDTFERLMKGGDNGAIVVAGKSTESELLRRAQLPPDHEDHMPPAGKPQPTSDELAVLAWWVDAGASPDKSVVELNPPEDIVRFVQALSSATPRK